MLALILFINSGQKVVSACRKTMYVFFDCLIISLYASAGFEFLIIIVSNSPFKFFKEFAIYF